jgi:RNA polymerase sigma-70 factor, ECF subfamily
LNDAQLISRALEGDSMAERQLFDRHVDRVYQLCLRLSGDADLAQDFCQETFVKAFSRLDAFEGRAQFSTWLHRVAVNTSLNGMRRVQRTRAHETVTEEWAELAPAPANSDSALRRCLHRAIDELSEGMRAVFVMHEVEGYSHQEIAEALELEVGTSKARLSRARAQLREILRPLTNEGSQAGAQEGMS